MKNKKIIYYYKNNQNIKEIIKKYQLNFLNGILKNENILSLNYSKSKIKYNTLHKNNQPTNYNKITITTKKTQTHKNIIYTKYYKIILLEYETIKKDYYKIIKIYQY